MRFFASMENNNDEIDLVELTLKVARFFRAIRWQLVIGVLAGAVLGAGFYWFMPKQYESKMLVQSEVLTASLGKTMVSDLNLLIKERSWDTLASKLNVDKGTAMEMVNVELKSALERPDQLKEREKNALEVTVRTTDPEKLKFLQTGIETYLSSNPFSKEFETLKKNYYRSVIKRYDEQIERLKEMQAKFVEGKLYSASKESTYLFDPSVFSSRLLNCELDKLKYEDSIRLKKNVRVIVGFTAFQKPVFPRPVKSIGMGLVLGFVLMLLLNLIALAKKVIK